MPDIRSAGGAAAWTRPARALRKEKTLRHDAAKDILRAARLPLLLDPDDSELAADLRKVSSGNKLPSVLLPAVGR
jgi:hypothetical protein